LSPQASGVLGPREIVSILDLVGIAFLSDFIEDFQLSDMNCDDSLNSCSQLLVHFFKAHLCKISENSIKELLFLIKFDDLLFVASFKALSNILGPKNLDTKKGDLRWVGKRVISGGHGVAILSTRLAFDSDRSLHRFFKFN